ncbi:hypothetical protein H4R35_005669 [Dimargaris xerosporica]|nr:hypothetical protein H4R35_005669 [Dimargaris xerosporica]
MPLVPEPARDFVAGTMGGWAQVVVGHPFDTIKVRLQTQPDPPKFRSGIHCFQLTLKEEGARGLYKGVTSPLAGIGICNAVVFAANGYFRRLLQGPDATSNPLSLGQYALAGGLAGGVMAFFNCPIELLKVKLQVQYRGQPAAGSSSSAAAALPKPYTGVFDCGVRTFKDRGLRGLYRGLPITILRDMPSFACYFGTYEAIKMLLLRARVPVAELHSDNAGDVTNTGMELFFAGGLAGIAAWIPCYPQDVIKSRMQSNPQIRNTRACVQTLLSEARAHGWRIYFKGFGPTIARAFPANAATFVAYETTMKFIQ